MKINSGWIFASFLFLECVVGSSIPSGTVVSRKPAVINKPTPTTKSSPIKTSEVQTTFEETISEDIPVPTSTTHEEIDHKSETTVTSLNLKESVDPSMDPTDYSTVWPTRWRPRRRLNFGAEGDAGKSQASPDYLLIWLVIIGAFISGILL